MYSLNLDYFSVEQGNHEGLGFTHDAWDSNSKKALNDVVDPNTEFQITASNVAPVSTLESYGFPRSIRTPLYAESTTGSLQIVDTKRTTGVPAVEVSGRASGVGRKETNSLRMSQEIPQVHGPRKFGASQNGALAVAKRSKRPSNTNSIRAQQNPSIDDQAWPFGNARDGVETESNTSKCSSRFDLESNFSDRADTVSTLSNVSGYEEELFRIRRLLLDPASSYREKRPETLGRENGFPNDALFRIPARDVRASGAVDLKEAALGASLDQHRENANARLQKVNAEVEALKQAVGKKSSEANDAPSSKTVRLSAAKSKLSSQSFESTDFRWTGTSPDAVNERLRKRLQALVLDIDSKDGAIRGLKQKIAEQHVELQTLRQTKLGAENGRASANNDLETARKSASWYRDQLHACQAAKAELERRLMASQAAAVSSVHAADRLGAEAERLRSLAADTQERAVREKDELMKKLEAIHHGMLQREAAILEQLRREKLLEPAPVHVQNAKKSRCGPSTSESDESESRRKLDEAEGELRSARAENAELARKASVAEKDKEAVLRELHGRFGKLQRSYEGAVEELRGAEKSALRVKKEMVVLEGALTTAGREKTEVDEAIEDLRGDFARIQRQYEAMRGELLAKEGKTPCRERWDLEELAAQREEIVAGFASVVGELRNVQSKLAEANVLEKLLHALNDKHGELSRQVRENNRVNGPAGQLEETLAFQEEQTAIRARSFAAHGEDIKSRYRLVTGLWEDKEALRASIESLLEKVTARSEQEAALRKEAGLAESEKRIANEPRTTKIGILAPDFKHSSTQTDDGSSESGSVPSVSTSEEKQRDLREEVDRLADCLRRQEVAAGEDQRRYDSNVRTLMKKVTEHIRGRKAAERSLAEFRGGAGVLPAREDGGDEEALAEIGADDERGEGEGDRRQPEVSTPVAASPTSQKPPMDETETLKHVGDLEEEIRRHQATVRELGTEISSEKRANCALRATVANLTASLATANDVLDSTKVALGRSEAMSEILHGSVFRLQRDLDAEQVGHENCKQLCERVKKDLEEMEGSEAEFSHETEVPSNHVSDLGRYAAGDEDELAGLQAELQALQADKMALQAQVCELRTATQSTLQQNRLLRLRVDALSKPASSQAGLPALSSSLPPAPMKYNELQIAELLRASQEYQLPWNQPLNSLQSCLDSLKTEMTTLQQQLIAKTTPRERKDAPVQASQ